MTSKKRTYEPRIFEWRVMLPEAGADLHATPHVEEPGGKRFHAQADPRGVARAGAQAGTETATLVMPDPVLRAVPRQAVGDVFAPTAAPVSAERVGTSVASLDCSAGRSAA